MMHKWRRVLLVDNDLVCSYVAEALAGEGHQVKTARTASAALAEFGSGKFDVVFVGSHLPDSTGFDLAKGLKERNPAQIIIMLSSLGPLEPTTTLWRVISKPFVYQDFRDALAELPE